MYAIQDDHYSYLPCPRTRWRRQRSRCGRPGDIPNTGAQAEALSGKPGRITAISPSELISMLGSPRLQRLSRHPGEKRQCHRHVAPEKQVDVSDNLARYWAFNPAPGASGIIPYYGLRLTGVQGWQPTTCPAFLSETLFLKQFHEDTRCSIRISTAIAARGPMAATLRACGQPYYLTNPSCTPPDTYRQFASGADQNAAARRGQGAALDLEGFADSNVSTLQENDNLYVYDQSWAQEEPGLSQGAQKTAQTT